MTPKLNKNNNILIFLAATPRFSENSRSLMVSSAVITFIWFRRSSNFSPVISPALSSSSISLPSAYSSLTSTSASPQIIIAFCINGTSLKFLNNQIKLSISSGWFFPWANPSRIFPISPSRSNSVRAIPSPWGIRISWLNKSKYLGSCWTRYWIRCMDASFWPLE